MYSLCRDCTERSRKCKQCKSNNRQATMEELQELKMIQDSVSIISKDGQQYLQCTYPIMGDPTHLYRAELSNSEIALKKSTSLFKRHHKLKLADPFHAEILKSIDEDHMRFFSPAEEQAVLSDWHAFAGLNYSLKTSSNKQKICPVCDSSLHHKSGSLNS